LEAFYPDFEVLAAKIERADGRIFLDGFLGRSERLRGIFDEGESRRRDGFANPFAIPSPMLPILTPNALDKVPPKISIGGEKRVKSIYLSNSLILLINEYCRKTGLTIREVVEVALVEYFSKYGFEREIDNLLNR